MRLLGLLGSWALLVLGLGLASIAAAGEWINMRDSRHLDRVALVDKMIAERTGDKAGKLRTAAEQRAAEVGRLQQRVNKVAADDTPDNTQTIIISTAENKLYVRRNAQTVFEALCSTGKGTRLALDGKTLVFETPIGRFKIKQKEENPQWVPPDWHYAEEAQKNGMRVIRLNPGSKIDADSGDVVRGNDSSFWSWLGGGGGSKRVYKMRGNTVVLDEGGVEREMPPGKTIVAGGTIVIPPVDSPQRHYDKVLGKYRLELGDGYGIHGTDQPEKLGQSVSHGCVRLGDQDIERLYGMANVGDTVVIY
jgi:lipoprotein-anchoring transpeptidase ErfK/SrfK